jgi:hypothetical protein
MDKPGLVEQDVREGRRLIEALDRAGFPLPVACWLNLKEIGVWQLRLGSPLVQEQGSRSVYGTIQTILAAATPKIAINLDDIKVVAESDPIAMELRISAGTDGMPFIGAERLSSVFAGDEFVQNAILYRAERIVGVSGDAEWTLAIPEVIQGHRKWRQKKARLVFNKGYTSDVIVDNYPLKKRYTKNGVSTAFYAFNRIKNVGAKQFGDIRRIVIRDGSLRTVEDIRSHVEVSA